MFEIKAIYFHFLLKKLIQNQKYFQNTSRMRFRNHKVES